jgi:xanthine/uracil permease
MLENLAQNWPVYLLGGAFIVFFGAVISNSRQVEKKKRSSS